MYEYTTRVFSVGLEGFAAVDTDMIGTMTAEGWEPTLMTPVHNGFATLVLFRRDGAAAGWVAPAARSGAGAKAKPVAAKAKPAAPAARVRRERPAR